jgi:uncharacterized protein YbgA (DUF1722 family)/uncharacterized protein YbbK (DUF523 family)
VKLGISACLLGEKIRYDGGHKLDHYLTDMLGRFVEWVPVCPEVGIGLSVPREAMRLVEEDNDIRLKTINTGSDYTDRMVKWSNQKLKELEAHALAGFIFKSRSPSSGLAGVKVYRPAGGILRDGTPRSDGIGIFARQFIDHFPLIPVIDESRLYDNDLRENFIERIFVYDRWQTWFQTGPRARLLVDFHTRHKLLVMSHSIRHLGDLGRIVAQASGRKVTSLLPEYLKTLMAGMAELATIKKHTNVLDHIAGYFKKSLSRDERLELTRVISDYHRGLTPLIVPITLVKHYVRRLQEPYLKDQYYLTPHPLELKLRNHA